MAKITPKNNKYMWRTAPLLKPPQSPHCYLGAFDHAKKIPPIPGHTTSPVWDDILTPLYIDTGVNISYDILTQGSIYRNDILTPLTIFWPPS